MTCGWIHLLCWWIQAESDWTLSELHLRHRHFIIACCNMLEGILLQSLGNNHQNPSMLESQLRTFAFNGFQPWVQYGAIMQCLWNSWHWETYRTSMSYMCCPRSLLWLSLGPLLVTVGLTQPMACHGQGSHAVCAKAWPDIGRWPRRRGLLHHLALEKSIPSPSDSMRQQTATLSTSTFFNLNLHRSAPPSPS